MTRISVDGWVDMMGCWMDEWDGIHGGLAG